MAPNVIVAELLPSDWRRLRDLRLAALADSPAILSGKLDEERNFTEEQWRETFKKLSYVVATIDGQDVAMINVCLLYTSPSPRDLSTSRMPSSA